MVYFVGHFLIISLYFLELTILKFFFYYLPIVCLWQRRLVKDRFIYELIASNQIIHSLDVQKFIRKFKVTMERAPPDAFSKSATYFWNEFFIWTFFLDTIRIQYKYLVKKP